MLELLRDLGLLGQVDIKVHQQDLRSYPQALAAWLTSDCTDNSRLLRGQALQDAQAMVEPQQSQHRPNRQPG